MFQEADDALFRTILSSKSHVLYTYLSERPDTHYEPETTINFVSQKLAISVIDISSLECSIKTYTDAILQTKFMPICRYRSLCTICNHRILLYVYVYNYCTQLRLTTVFKK